MALRGILRARSSYLGKRPEQDPAKLRPDQSPSSNGVRLLLLQKKTGQCFGLNGAIFLGSILLWDYGLAPGMAWMLAGRVFSNAFSA